MIEHVGRRQFGAYFRAIRKLLKPGGKALVHSAVDWPYGPIIPWLERYIFPGAEVLQTSDLIEEASHAGLSVEAGPFHHDGIHYATTLAEWRRRFLANYSQLDQEKYPEQFKRMWLLYLAGCEASFRGTSLHIAQIVYTRLHR